VLGVAFVVGTFVFTDTLGRTFDDLFAQTVADVTVAPKQAFQASFDTGQGAPVLIPAALVHRISQAPGVARAEGDVQAKGVQLVGPDGKVIGSGGAPGIGVNWSAGPGSSLHLLSGRAPTSREEIAVDSTSATEHHIALGDTVPVLTPGPRLAERVVGIFRFGQSGSLAGATLTAFDPRTAQQLLAKPGHFTGISVTAAPGASPADVKTAVQAVLPGNLQAGTDVEQADSQTADIKQGLRFINIFLLVFAFVALFVGSFIILNTFSMLVAQRTRELALLRALGASRRQVTRSVLGEALVLGAVGAAVGLGVGIALAVGLQKLFGAFGLAIPTGSLVVAPRTVLAALVVGVGVTVVAAWFPARRAARVAPVAALRTDDTVPQASLRRRTIAGVALVVLAVAALASGLTVARGSSAASLVGLGAWLLLLGVAVLSPVLNRPIMRVLGAAYPRLFGSVGRLSRENALRNPRRSAATASALMIGLALVTAISILGASTNASVTGVIDRVVGADYVVNNATKTPFSPQVADQLARVPGVQDVTRQRVGAIQVAGKQTFFSAVSPTFVDAAVHLNVSAGSAQLGRDVVLVDEPTARSHGWHPGSTFRPRFLDGSTPSLRVGGTYPANLLVGAFVVGLQTFTAHGGGEQDEFLYVRKAADADTGTVHAGLTDVLRAYPNVQVKDQTQFKADQRKQVGQLINLIYALLGLAVVIAVLGIVNTLALSVIERTREIGLLRAVGLSRRQLRRMVRLESTLIAVFGGLLGLAVGAVFGVALQHALRSQGIDVLAVPVGQLLGFLLLAALIGVLAALWPARRAARLDVLTAIATE